MGRCNFRIVGGDLGLRNEDIHGQPLGDPDISRGYLVDREQEVSLWHLGRRSISIVFLGHLSLGF